MSQKIYKHSFIIYFTAPVHQYFTFYSISVKKNVANGVGNYGVSDIKVYVGFGFLLTLDAIVFY